MRLVVAGKGPAYEAICDMVPCVRVPSGSELVGGDVLLSVQYDKIVTARQLEGYVQAVNLHFGVLPFYRGCFPTKWAIINGEPAGVTLHHMTPRIDDGPIIDTYSFSTDDMTDLDVYTRCNQAAVMLFTRWKSDICAGQLPPGEPQDESQARYYKRRLPFDGKMPADASPLLRNRLVRAFHHPPYPGLQG